jgi:hypothetical protein
MLLYLHEILRFGQRLYPSLNAAVHNEDVSTDQEILNGAPMGFR